jgi:hypothetical protein
MTEALDTPALLTARGLSKYYPVRQGVIPRTVGQVHTQPQPEGRRGQ